MRVASLATSIVLSLMIGSISAWGQEISKLQLSHSAIAVGEELTVEVTITGLPSKSRCGLRIDFGMQEGEDVRLGPEAQSTSVIVIKRQVKSLGPMAVRAYGKSFPTGANSLMACGGRVLIANVDVVLPQNLPPTQREYRGNSAQAPEPVRS